VREVTYDVELTNFRQAQIGAEHLTAHIVGLGHVERRQSMPGRAGS